MTAQVCAASDAWVCVAVRVRVRAHACGLCPSALQSRKCVYPVRVTDGDLLSRVMSELAPITLGCWAGRIHERPFLISFILFFAACTTTWNVPFRIEDGFVPGRFSREFPFGGVRY